MSLGFAEKEEDQQMTIFPEICQLMEMEFVQVQRVHGEHWYPPLILGQ